MALHEINYSFYQKHSFFLNYWMKFMISRIIKVVTNWRLPYLKDASNMPSIRRFI